MFKLIGFVLRRSDDVSRSRMSIALVVVTSLIAGGANAVLLMLINQTLTGAAANGLGFVTCCVLMFVGRVISGVLLARLAQTAMFELSVKFSARILAAPLKQLEELGPPRLLAALTHDVPAIATTLSAVPVLFMHIAVLAVCLVYLGWLSWLVLVIVVVFIALGIVTYQLPLNSAVRHLKLARDERDGLSKHYRALTDGTKELKLNRSRRRAFMDDHLRISADAVRRYNASGNSIFAVAASWGNLLIFILVGLLITVLPNYVSMNQQTVTGYALILLYMMTPLEVILNSLPVLGQANVAAKKIEQLGLSLESSPEEVDSPDELSDSRFSSLELTGVTYSYQDKTNGGGFSLGPLTAAFKPGEVVFLTGGNGSGKTTLAKLLTGLYAPNGGEVWLNGRLITDETREHYRQQFSVVFSDFYLFEALLDAARDGQEARAREILAQLQLSHKVDVKDGALSTIDLSQGQRRRLALLTAYLEDRPIYLFDEWAADQEPLFKEVFYYQVLPKLKAAGKLAVVISHDDRYFHVADRILKLEYGRLEADNSIPYISSVRLSTTTTQ